MIKLLMASALMCTLVLADIKVDVQYDCIADNKSFNQTPLTLLAPNEEFLIINDKIYTSSKKASGIYTNVDTLVELYPNEMYYIVHYEGNTFKMNCKEH